MTLYFKHNGQDSDYLGNMPFTTSENGCTINSIAPYEETSPDAFIVHSKLQVSNSFIVPKDKTLH